jgi:hypothetical protein
MNYLNKVNIYKPAKPKPVKQGHQFSGYHTIAQVQTSL